MIHRRYARLGTRRGAQRGRTARHESALRPRPTARVRHTGGPRATAPDRTAGRAGHAPRRPRARRTAGVLLCAGALTALVLTPVRAGAATDRAEDRCDVGRLCLWRQPDFAGTRYDYELTDTGTQSCVSLPGGGTARALANRMGRPVTGYQSAECAETGEFATYPGGGTFVPRTPYVVRAFKVWER